MSTRRNIEGWYWLDVTSGSYQFSTRVSSELLGKNARPATLIVTENKKKVWQWRYWHDDGAGEKCWKVAKRLMDMTEALEFFAGVNYDIHAGPFEVES